MVSLSACIAHRLECQLNVIIPDAPTLFCAIHCLYKSQDHSVRNIKARRRSHEDLFLKLPIKVSRLDVHLMDFQVVLISEHENSTERGKLSDRRKGLVIVNALNL